MKLTFESKKKTVLTIALGVFAVAFVTRIVIYAIGTANKSKQLMEAATAPKDQIEFENKWTELNAEVEKADKGGNDYLHREAIDKRKRFLETNALRVNNWIGTVGAVSAGFTSDCEIKCWGGSDNYQYGYEQYYLQFKNISDGELKKLQKGTKIRFSGNRSTQYSFFNDIPSAIIITDGTFSILNQN